MLLYLSPGLSAIPIGPGDEELCLSWLNSNGMCNTTSCSGNGDLNLLVITIYLVCYGY